MSDDRIWRELHALRLRVPHMTGSLVATCDGFLVASDLPDSLEPEGMAAMAATELSLSDRVARTAADGDFEEVVIRNRGGHVAIYAAGPRAALAILAGPEVTLGRLHLEARPVARAIAAIVPETTVERTISVEPGPVAQGDDVDRWRPRRGDRRLQQRHGAGRAR
ncbi:roadblock/LC7 domain-containing protein [Actinocorallia sp. API 0066]|uniref:roadblock/LC7 domain-containing protein n=1 Tax=Actinocorallia sp. API 0066 TaxID=2896846 RepID=UPI001E569521|nr:roadblock/LC7 domain-containing protein [Actinocorallia sp. API 0066]MCD0449890.1 roadblock/LC7 domain-containing protein [Actinocorallia sp. API 0066]